MLDTLQEFDIQSLKELRRAEQWEEIDASARKLLSNNTLPIFAAAEWAFALAKMGKNVDAERIAVQVLQASPACLVAMRARVAVLLQEKHPQQALLLAQSLFKPPFVLDNPEEAANCILLLAVAHKEIGEIEKASELAREAQRIYPTANGYAFLGLLAFMQSNFEQATIYFVESLKIKSVPKVWNLLAEVYRHQNRIDDLIRTYEEASQACTNYEPFWVKLGELYFKLHRYDEATHCLCSSLEKHPLSASGWLVLSKVYFALNRRKNCEEALRAAIKIAPNDAEIIYNLALLYASANANEEAFTLLEAAYTLAPENEQISLAYAQHCEVNDKHELADSLFEQVLAKNPDAPSVLKCRANIAMMRNELDEGLGFVKQALANELWFLKQQSSLSLFGDGSHPPMDVYDASETLIAVCKFLEDLNVTYFLASGTLLGIVRGGELLAHDKDADLGITWDVDREWLIKQFEDSEEFGINGACPDSEIAEWNFSVVRKGTPIGVDFFFYKPDGEDWLTGFHSSPTPWLQRFKQRPLTTIEYKGHQLSIPENPEGYLEEVYGPNWRTPMPSYDTLIAAENLCPEAYTTATIIGYNRLYEALRNRSWKKVLWYCEALKRFDNPPILDELANWLRGAMPPAPPKN